MFVSQSNEERKRMRFREGLGFRAIGATPLDIFAMNLGFFEELRAVSDRQRRVKMLDECTEGRLHETYAITYKLTDCNNIYLLRFSDSSRFPTSQKQN
ncbi:hypothetical protein L2E82_42521 [Cichorium intybus]|uniref:Uncharacterized protein n=1 Tax=Cichorium intybus TaxID=13427 RepID=A0ACB8ZL70_CICIN|nr:hypothetical protein L2E82_42521 [Cichorium intybus]